MSQLWDLPGFRVGELLSEDGGAQTWSAHEDASGEPVLLRRVRPGVPAAAAALRREADLLCAVDSPYVLRLRTVVGSGEEAVLVLDCPPGGSLARLLGRRGRLDPGEVVTVAVPLAHALGAAHARGLLHGALAPEQVWFTGHGMPLLAGFGGVPAPAGEQPLGHVDPRVAGGAAPDQAGDVWALAALCRQLLTGSPPYGGRTAAQVLAAPGDRTPLGPGVPHPALAAAVESGLAADPGARPSAVELAAALQRAEPAAAVRLVDVPSVAELGGPPLAPSARAAPGSRVVPAEDDGPAPGAGPRSGRARTGAFALASAMLLAAGVLWALHRGHQHAVPVAAAAPPAGAAAGATPAPDPPGGSGAAPAADPPGGPAGPPAPGPTPRVVVTIDPQPPLVAVPPPPGPPDWRQVLQDLDGSRQRAYATGDAELLAGVYVAGSAAATEDGATLSALLEQGRTATGVRHEVRSVQQLAVDADRAELRVADSLAPQVVLDRAGAVVARAPGRGPTSYSVTLRRQDGGWRIERLQGSPP